MEGHLSENPLAELIAEITDSQLSGVVRLNRGRIKVAIYFDKGKLIYAASNVRSHRLANFIRKQMRANGAPAPELPDATDDEIAEIVVARGFLTSPALDSIRQDQVAEVLRIVLLWTDGSWSFDPRVRLAEAVRLSVDVERLLLESARHLPADFINERLNRMAGTFSAAATNGKANLLPEEAFVLSRADAPASLAELQAISGFDEARAFRAIYGLSLAGLINHSQRRHALSLRERAAKPQPRPAVRVSTAENDEQTDLQNLFSRLDSAADYYEVLGVARMAAGEEIKIAYHELARNYHPDRFHQRAPQLRARLEAAFARIAQAYETLSDEKLRQAYDKGAKNPHKSSSVLSGMSKGESSFQKGQDALRAGRRAEALRFLSEAAMQDPRSAKYRAAYGKALIGEPNNRRLAESELQAAIALDPSRPSYRVILAELYQENGLRRRAISELQRALTVDPANETARALLSKLQE